ncbi:MULTISPECIES: hypothetical protein [unclassified Legionella]|uniref:hypothetical protein n=1 Tax=unclassified Legionella TaxID=2622702 RepID=UPI001056613C|nr:MULTISPECIES: hypothetical protein [unclassified Legionella]MDI9819509.1 hypothetical protein [Legionella sp. PL877]
MDAKTQHTPREQAAARIKSRKESHQESHVGEAAIELLNESKKMANELYEQGRDRVYEAQNNLKGYSNEVATKVQQHPLTSLLVAGGIGFLLSAIFRR